MDDLSIRAERLFNEALELPRGEPRAKFLADRCGNDAALLKEVQSLLDAHDQSGRFLEPQSAASTEHVHPNPLPTPGSPAVTTALRVEEFLHAHSHPTDDVIEGFLADLPDPARQEARERHCHGVR